MLMLCMLFCHDDGAGLSGEIFAFANFRNVRVGMDAMSTQLLLYGLSNQKHTV